MDKAILRLAAYLLADYASELTNRGCNDPSLEMLMLIEEIGKDNFQQMANEWNGSEMTGHENNDWIIAEIIAYKIKQMSEPIF